MKADQKIREALAEACERRGFQAELASMLGVHSSTVKRWIDGVEIPLPVQSLLKWYFLGIIPPSITNTLDLKGVLEFTEAEWACIGLLAKRAGQSSHAAYIRSSILVTIAPYMEREVQGNSRNGKTA